MQPNTSTLSNSIRTAAAAIIIMVGLHWGASFFGPLIFAFTLTLLIWPILEWFRKKGVPRGLGISIVAISLVLAVAALILIVASSLKQLSANIPIYTQLLNDRFQPLLNLLSKSGLNIETLLADAGFSGSTIAQAGIVFASSFLGNVYSVVMFLLMHFLMVVASDDIVSRFKKHANKESSFTTQFATWSKYVQAQYRVQTISNLISGVLSTGIFLLLRIDYAILWGTLVFLLAYIPNFGIVIASIPPVLLAFILHGWPAALIVITFITLLNIVMDNVVTPRLMGAQLDVPSIAVFISFIFFSFIFGILGAFIALPLLLALRQILALHSNTKPFALLLGAKEE